ncbi:hypothetical protein H0H87_004983 [Tephrocybe sp. NHM501043]|nr:hypothetical protein H0H87_004983 [Tephrocybe sp. NHM501043]
MVNATAFSVLLHTLGLTQGSYKPAPRPFSVGGNSSKTPSSYAVNVPPGAQMLLGSSKGAPPLSKSSQDECYVEPYSPPPIKKQVFPPYDHDMATLYRYRQQQSVNLGSWFVHENWMTPSLLGCAGGSKLSELDIASGWGSMEAARALLERHWDTFITKSDFKYLASIGINTVRLPVGYWNLGPSFCKDTPFGEVAEVYANSWPRVERAINWAGEFGMGVLVDLHGAVGSQNGQPHSGISDGASDMFAKPEFLDKTIAVQEHLMRELASVSNVVGIQLLNEPKNVPELEDVYTRMIEAMRQVSIPSANAASFPLYLHDGFDLGRFDAYGANRTDFIVQDHHSYFVFTPSDQNEAASEHTKDVHGPIYKAFAEASSKERRNLVIDEWSCALTAESIANEPDKDQARRDLGKGQMDVYAATSAGWSFWSYAKEDCEDDIGWCFKAAVGKSLPATFFSYEKTPIDPKRTREISTFVANMNAPSTSEILSGQATNDTASDSSVEKQARFVILPQEGVPRRQHRSHAIHLRNQPDDQHLTPVERTTVKGYIDGFVAAKKFALGGFAKLGFIGQFVSDNMPKDLEAGTEQNYRDGFGRGLMEGQRQLEVKMAALESQ